MFAILHTYMSVRISQAERRALSRDALVESAARGLSREGYGSLVLEQVAADAGYTRGAIYHQFRNKEELALAVVAWVAESWEAEVGRAVEEQENPLDALIALARGHAVYCRRDVARVRMALSVEFGSAEHPVGVAVETALDTIIDRCARLVTAGRRSGVIPTGPPAKTLARAIVGAIEGVLIQLAGRPPYDERLAVRALIGLLAIEPREQGQDTAQ
jgi:AcrR family transcriptional regulator